MLGCTDRGQASFEKVHTELAKIAEPETALWRGWHAIAGHVHKATAAVALQQVVEIGFLLFTAHTAHAQRLIRTWPGFAQLTQESRKAL